MICSHCGKKLDEGKPCDQCNPFVNKLETPLTSVAFTKLEKPKNNDGTAIAALMLGIVSLLTCGGCGILPIIGFILGILGLKSQKSGIAVGGICLNALALLLGLIALASFFTFGLFTQKKIHHFSVPPSQFSVPPSQFPVPPSQFPMSAEEWFHEDRDFSSNTVDRNDAIWLRSGSPMKSGNNIWRNDGTPIETSVMKESEQRITSFLTFNGTAESAMNFYAEILPGTKIQTLEHLPYREGAKTCILSIQEHRMMFLDIENDDTPQFTRVASFVLHYRNEREFDLAFSALQQEGTVMTPPKHVFPKARKVAWITDQFGISWLLIFQ
jgi:predicted 3-demethylubiquinone-9 3-methyltransferase (glyoxalase superfamily)